MVKGTRSTESEIPAEITGVIAPDTEEPTIVGFSMPDRFRTSLIAEITSSLASQIYAKNIQDGKPGMPEQTRKEIVRDATKLADEILKAE